MSKTLAIVSYSSNTVNTYFQQINSLFADSLQVKRYCINSSEIMQGIVADAVLLPSYDVFEKIKGYLKKTGEIVFCNRTISKAGFDKIMGIPAASEVVLIDESKDMAKQMVSALCQIGVKHLCIKPSDARDMEDMSNKTVIILGDSSYIPDKAREIVNIGNSMLDISTIIEIGNRLDLDHLLNRQNIRKSYKEIVTANIGLAQVLGKTNRFESSLDILLQVIDTGVIGVNSRGQVFACNNKAKSIMGLEMVDMIGKDSKHLFPKLPFDHVIQSSESIEGMLEDIKGNSIIISIDPLIHSGRLQGAVAVIKSFNEEERKQHKIRAQLIGKGYVAKNSFKDIVGESEAIKKCKNIAKRMANSNSSILLTGESGTGKEMFAQAIHNSSNRKDYQFVAVNCGALPESLLESELFGYEEGAFTGARKGGRAGLFELAHKGTLFLDEIGEMPLSLQMKLLRVLQEREIMRLGGDRLISVDIRLIAATNRNLKGMVTNGKFREDLYYRLSVLPLVIPPLRSRREDILPLMEEFKKRMNSHFVLTPEAKLAFLNHSWKGNVRELSNYVEYIVNLDLKEVDVRDLPFEFENSEESLAGENQSIRAFTTISGGNLKKYLFVLEELQKGFLERRRLGRRSISQIAWEKGLFLSEQEIRSIILSLEKNSLVEVYPGKGGTVITELGRETLKYFLKK